MHMQHESKWNNIVSNVIIQRIMRVFTSYKVIILCMMVQGFAPFLCAQEHDQDEDSVATHQQQARRIVDIIIEGNVHTPTQAIAQYIPYHKDEIFDPVKTRTLIRNVYYGLKRFRTVSVKGKNVGDDGIIVYVTVVEKTPLKEVLIKGNKQISEKDIQKEVAFADVPAVDPEELKIYAQRIQKMYQEKGYYHTSIDTELRIDDDGRGIAIFTVREGKKSLIRKISFTGNEHISSKELRSILYTQEDWLLGFLSKAGTYHYERVQYGDKQVLEHYYQNHGFLHAKVHDITVDTDPDTHDIQLKFAIEEGDLYRIGTVTAPGNELVSEAALLAHIPIRPGMIYTRDAISSAIKRLERVWGNQGYIFAHIEPSIEPDEDTKTVNLSFISDLGEKMYVNRITVRGNQKSRDKIIRRKLVIEEGDLITQAKLDVSRLGVESLGYFDPVGGVNWKIKRLGGDQADLDLIVKEAKTGSFGANIGFGGAGVDLRSPVTGMTVKGEFADTNLLGTGVSLNASASWAKEEQLFLFHVAQPWMFDKPILGAMDLYHRRPTYDELRNITPNPVHEQLTGGSLTGGVLTPPAWPIFPDIRVLGSFGLDAIRYQQRPVSSITPLSASAIAFAATANAEYQTILNKSFDPGDFLWLGCTFEQDTRNHPVHTSHGHKWKIFARVAIPTFSKDIGFYKVTLDAQWFTPLIGEYDLVLRLHGYAGAAVPLKNRTIPFGELYHIGGDNSVRGFLFGQIGPRFLGDTIGSKKALFVNVELIFPLLPDMTVKALVFYDGGAGWDNPYTQGVSPVYLEGNRFDYRHSVGFGLRLLKPMPIRVDWGFKIDPRKDRADPARGESSSEVHFGMSYAFD